MRIFLTKYDGFLTVPFDILWLLSSRTFGHHNHKSPVYKRGWRIEYVRLLRDILRTSSMTLCFLVLVAPPSTPSGQHRNQKLWWFGANIYEFMAVYPQLWTGFFRFVVCSTALSEWIHHRQTQQLDFQHVLKPLEINSSTPCPRPFHPPPWPVRPSPVSRHGFHANCSSTPYVTHIQWKFQWFTYMVLYEEVNQPCTKSYPC